MYSKKNVRVEMTQKILPFETKCIMKAVALWTEHFFLHTLYDRYVLTYLMFLACVNIKRKRCNHSFYY